MVAVKEKLKSKARKAARRKSTSLSPEREKKMLRLVDDAIRQRAKIVVAERELEHAKEEQKACKEQLESEQSELNGIIAEIEAIRDGKPLQGTLPLETNGAAVDPALIVLKLSDSMIEKFGEAEITTVGQLEKAMADGKVVPNRIKGIGQTAVDKVTDALMKYRAEHPIAAPEDKPTESKPEATK